jgi:hypothetical protein
MSVSDITTFFSSSTRSENDATNKVREGVLKLISNPPKEYLEHPEFGNSWRIVHEAWNDILKKIAEEKGVPEYTSTQLEGKGGRKFNYDGIVKYYSGTKLVGTIMIEFKKGGAKISDQPQFLSLQAKFPVFAETYDKYFYENYLDQYIACDPGITLAKPSREMYLKKVTGTNYNSTPFFAQIKGRELFCQDEKNAIVNQSITDYLTKYGKDIDLKCFSDKVKATQTDKVYLLWSNGKFCSDKISESEMCDMTYHSIKNGNVLEIKSGNTMYGLLLRWRNHKGILNPAWQISMKRLA